MTEFDSSELLTHDVAGETPERVPVEPAEDPVTEDYSADGTWAGLPKFKCNHCRYDSVTESDIKRHVQTHYVRKPGATIYGPDGTAI